MGLPFELLQYAENLYRRFPEEFIALGMPGLEEIYDLRPNGTWSRRMLETPMDKTVEITIRRWQAPTLVPLQGLHGTTVQASSQFPPMAAMGPSVALFHPQHAAAATGYLQQQHQPHMMTSYSTAAHPPESHGPTAEAVASTAAGLARTAAAAPPTTGPVGGAAAEDQASTLRLARLESALSALKPQIEALLVAQAQTQAPAQASTAHRQPGTMFSTDGNQGLPDKRENTLSPDSYELRVRRSVSQLQIQTCPKAKAQEKQAPQVVKINDADSEGEPSADEPSARASMKIRDADSEGMASGDEPRPFGKDGQRQRPGKVHAVRVADSATDPVSPRSPGRYSAWK